MTGPRVEVLVSRGATQGSTASGNPTETATPAQAEIDGIQPDKVIRRQIRDTS